MVSRTLTVCLFGCLYLFPSSSLAQPRVAVSIRPLHSLAAGVMEGVGVPELVIKSGASPHGSALRPSQALLLSRADVVFWGGALLEPHLKKPLAARGDSPAHFASQLAHFLLERARAQCLLGERCGFG